MAPSSFEIGSIHPFFFCFAFFPAIFIGTDFSFIFDSSSLSLFNFLLLFRKCVKTNFFGVFLLSFPCAVL